MWTVKYKPHIIDDMCGDMELFKQVKLNFDHNENMILYGSSGTGKSLILHCLLKDIKPSQIYNFNTCTDRGIKHIRTELTSFLKRKVDVNTLDKKVILIEDLINMNEGSQHGFCSLMDTYPNTCFIFCTNSCDSIIESIQSRCCFVPFKQLTSKQIIPYIKNILTNEGYIWEEEALLRINDYANGDMRKYINMLQTLAMFSDNKKIVTNYIQCIIKQPFEYTLSNIIKYCRRGQEYNAMILVSRLISKGFNHGDIVMNLFEYCLQYEFDGNTTQKILYLEELGKCHVSIIRGLYSRIQLDELIINLITQNK
jgi:DNA polymerase III delta prime subunit